MLVDGGSFKTNDKNPIAESSFIAVVAAVLFGVTTPFVKHFGQGAGAFATATLLYAGAAIGAGFPQRRPNEQAVGRAQIPRIAVVALFGATLAPAALAFGLQGAGALTASLLLNLEAVFTVLLAAIFFREPVGRRVLIAATLMVTGGAVLAFRVESGTNAGALGFLALCGATLCWALDNTLTRPLSEFDPQAVVFWKAGSGALLSVAIALSLRDAWPAPLALFALLACGAAGYGLSLRFYLRAQRVLGAARTGSLFALAPFVGTVVAYTLGDRSGMGFIAIAAPLFGAAVYLHLTETAISISMKR